MKRWLTALVAFLPVLLYAGCAGLRAAGAEPPAGGPAAPTVLREIARQIGHYVELFVPFLLGGAGLGVTGFGVQKLAQGTGALARVRLHAKKVALAPPPT